MKLLALSAQKLHEEFIDEMKEWFGFQHYKVPKLKVYLDEECISSSAGRFDRIGRSPEFASLTVDPAVFLDSRDSFIYALFVTAHETGHYLYWLRRPDRLKTFSLQEEVLVDMAALEFFRKRGLHNSYLRYEAMAAGVHESVDELLRLSTDLEWERKQWAKSLLSVRNAYILWEYDRSVARRIIERDEFYDEPIILHYPFFDQHFADEYHLSDFLR